MDHRARRFFFGGVDSPFVPLSPSQVIVDVDWIETPDSHIFKANLPGVKKNEAQVIVQDGHVLQITGEYKKAEEKNPVNWYSFERPVGKFFRQFELPENSIRVEDISAHQENGVLTISVPKKSPAKSVAKKVPITSRL